MNDQADQMSFMSEFWEACRTAGSNFPDVFTILRVATRKAGDFSLPRLFK